jgi:NADH-quinone oxidoreductase subunit J
VNIHDTLFWFFSIAMLLCGVLVIVNRNPVTSAMFLILLFFFMAGLFVLLEAFFLAAIQILVYAGAVMVLFLFVIMLLDIKAAQKKRFQWMAAIGALAIGGALVWQFLTIFSDPIARVGKPDGALEGTTREVAVSLFQKYALPFEIAALILLVAMIGVVLLSKKETAKETEEQKG